MTSLLVFNYYWCPALLIPMALPYPLPCSTGHPTLHASYVYCSLALPLTVSGWLVFHMLGSSAESSE